MKSFFLNIISSFIGVFLASIALGFVVISLIAGLVISLMAELESGRSVDQLTQPSALIIRLNYPVNERTSDDPFDHYDFRTMESRIVLGLDDIVDSIYHAIDDPYIAGIYLNVHPYNQGWASTESIRTALSDFRNSGKWIVSYNEYYSQQSYYLSSVANEIYLNPEGHLEFQGLSGQSLFLKETLKKLEIEMQVLRGNENDYKSAIETFVNSEMSEKSRYQTEMLLADFWTHFINEISSSRAVDIKTLNLIADNLSIQNAEDGVRHKLVDAVLHHDQVRDRIKTRMQISERNEIPAIPVEDYAMINIAQNPFSSFSPSPGGNQIAVIYADGDIMSGESDTGIVGSTTLAYTLRKAREDNSVKAIVLRVNSPGGSALASDVILREFFLTSQVKPALVSFGNVAASGGYYIGAAAHKVFAQPNTITGSIGVFGLFPNLKGFFNHKLGITFDSVNTHPYADFGNISQPLKPFEKQQLQKQVEASYITFKQHVAEGRSMTMEQVEELARGRVWSGISAKQAGLVDELGGLNAAILEAATLANISDYQILKLPETETPFKRIFKNADHHARNWLYSSFVTENFSELSPHLSEFQTVKQLKGIQARMPFSLVIE